MQTREVASNQVTLFKVIMIFLGLLGHLLGKHPEYTEKFLQKKAEVLEIRAERKSLIKKRKEERAEILEILNSVNLETDYLSWSPEAISGTSDTFKIGEAKDDFNLNESVYFSHNYFRRGKRGSEVAECLMCEVAHIKTLLKTTDGNTNGSALSTIISSKIIYFF